MRAGSSPSSKSASATRGHCANGRPSDKCQGSMPDSPRAKPDGSKTCRKMRSTRASRPARSGTTIAIAVVTAWSEWARARLDTRAGHNSDQAVTTAIAIVVPDLAGIQACPGPFGRGAQLVVGLDELVQGHRGDI